MFYLAPARVLLDPMKILHQPKTLSRSNFAWSGCENGKRGQGSGFFGWTLKLLGEGMMASTPEITTVWEMAGLWLWEKKPQKTHPPLEADVG